MVIDRKRLQSLAEGGDSDAARELLQLAERQNDTLRAARALVLLGERTRLVERAARLWRDEAWSALRVVLEGLGLEASESALRQLSDGMRAANGRRRKHRLEPETLLQLALRARELEHAGDPIRAPWPARWFSERRFRRSFCRAVHELDEVLLEVGVEDVASWEEPTPLEESITRVAMRIVELAHGVRPAMPPELAHTIDRIAEGDAEDLELPGNQALVYVLGTVEELREKPEFYSAAIAYAERAIAHWPLSTRTTPPHPRWVEALGEPHGRLIRGFDMKYVHLPSVVESTTASARARLRWLRLASGRHPEDAYAPLAGRTDLLSAFGALRELILEPAHNPVARAVIAASELPTQLDTLSLQLADAQVEDIGAIIERVAAHPTLRRLWLTTSEAMRGYELRGLRSLPTSLHLGIRNIAATSSLRALAKALGEHPLDSVWMAWVNQKALTPDGAACLGRVHGLRNVRVFIKPEAADALFEALSEAPLDALAVSNLGSWALDRPSERDAFPASALAKIPASVHTVHLRGGLDETASEVLSEQPWSALDEVRLEHSRMGNANLDKLARSGLFEGLRVLDLRDARLTGKGISALVAQVERGPAHLDLRHNSFSKPGVRALATWSGLSSVEYLDMRETNIVNNLDILRASPFLDPDALRLTQT